MKQKLYAAALAAVLLASTGASAAETLSIPGTPAAAESSAGTAAETSAETAAETSADTAAPVLPDEPSYWAASDIAVAQETGLVPDTLGPGWQRPVTREEFCDIVTSLIRSRGYGFSPVTTENPFVDTESENIRRLNNLGVVTGTNVGLFRPEAPLTRQEAAVILYRLTATVTMPTPWPDQRTAVKFTDLDELDSWARDGVYFCYNEGVLSGVGGDRFDPKGLYTVEQAVLSSLRMQRYAAAQEPTPITMTAGGVPMLYSNNPEILEPKVFERSGIHTAKTELNDGETIDAEYYYWSYMGSYQPLVVGVAVTNANAREDATIEVVQRGTGLGTDTMNVSEQCYQRFFLSHGENPVTVPAGKTKLVVKDTLPGGTMMNSRVRLIPHGEDLTARIVILKSEMASEYLEKVPRGLDDGYGRTAGRFDYSERTAKIDAESVKNFTLCGNTAALWALNPGEYPQRNDDPLAVDWTGGGHMSFFLNGNFATIYHLEFENAADKTLSIRPNDPTTKAAGGRYMVRTNPEGWHGVSATEEKPYTVSLKNNPTVDFLMLGGNYGNIGFHLS